MPNKMIAVIAFFLMTVAAFCAPPFEWEAKSAGNSLTVTARVAPGELFLCEFADSRRNRSRRQCRRDDVKPGSGAPSR